MHWVVPPTEHPGRYCNLHWHNSLGAAVVVVQMRVPVVVVVVDVDRLDIDFGCKIAVVPHSPSWTDHLYRDFDIVG